MSGFYASNAGAACVGGTPNGIWEIAEDSVTCPEDCAIAEYCSTPPDTINVADTGEYIVGTYVMPGWFPGGDPPAPARAVDQTRFESIWNKLTTNTPVKINGQDIGADQPIVPLINPYDESNPIAIDWAIKWGLENGLSLFIYDWFWHDGVNWFDNAKSFEQGFLKSKYVTGQSTYPVKFAVMLTNCYLQSPRHFSDDTTGMMNHAVENYFTHKNYFKIKNKPVFFIFRPDNIPAEKYVRAAYIDSRKNGIYGAQISSKAYITDGERESKVFGFSAVSQSNCVEVNLGGAHNVSSLRVWHLPNTTYYYLGVSVSETGNTWTNIYGPSTKTETASGVNYDLSGAGQVRYIRECVNGSAQRYWRNEWVEMEVWSNETGSPVNLVRDLAGSGEMEAIQQTINSWQNMARAHGFDGIYFIAISGVYGFDDPHDAKALGLEGLTAYYYPVKSTGTHKNYVTYSELITQYKNKWYQQYNYNHNYFPLVTPGYDDSPKKSDENASVITYPDPDSFKILLQAAKNFIDTHDISTKLVVVKAWNEWPESSVLAPTKKHGFGYLNAIKSVFALTDMRGPTTSISAPTDGAAGSGDVTVRALATDDAGVRGRVSVVRPKKRTNNEVQQRLIARP